MPDPVEGEWSLGYSATKIYPGADLRFGRMSSGIYCLTEPEVPFSDLDKGGGTCRAKTGSGWGGTTTGARP
ncbi:hypothetical protein [Streptomyces sp. 049-1]|uniref:hypothetical protein n=1 Tax=Streptomyces sp. 049-1 TaxID=2789264 RepID=UPI003980D985